MKTNQKQSFWLRNMGPELKLDHCHPGLMQDKVLDLSNTFWFGGFSLLSFHVESCRLYRDQIVQMNVHSISLCSYKRPNSTKEHAQYLSSYKSSPSPVGRPPPTAPPCLCQVPHSQERVLSALLHIQIFQKLTWVTGHRASNLQKRRKTESIVGWTSSRLSSYIVQYSHTGGLWLQHWAFWNNFHTDRMTAGKHLDAFFTTHTALLALRSSVLGSSY